MNAARENMDYIHTIQPRLFIYVFKGHYYCYIHSNADVFIKGKQSLSSPSSYNVTHTRKITNSLLSTRWGVCPTYVCWYIIGFGSHIQFPSGCIVRMVSLSENSLAYYSILTTTSTDN